MMTVTTQQQQQQQGVRVVTGTAVKASGICHISKGQHHWQQQQEQAQAQAQQMQQTPAMCKQYQR
jgi:hypothetical protein